jgi:hypothetical protein
MQALAALPKILESSGDDANRKAALEQISVSSDSCGSYPVYDEQGRLEHYRVGACPSGIMMALTVKPNKATARHTLHQVPGCCPANIRSRQAANSD